MIYVFQCYTQCTVIPVSKVVLQYERTTTRQPENNLQLDQTNYALARYVSIALGN